MCFPRYFQVKAKTDLNLKQKSRKKLKGKMLNISAFVPIFWQARYIYYSSQLSILVKESQTKTNCCVFSSNRSVLLEMGSELPDLSFIQLAIALAGWFYSACLQTPFFLLKAIQ